MNSSSSPPESSGKADPGRPEPTARRRVARLVAGVLLLVIPIVFTILLAQSFCPEPSYGGQRLNYWLDQYYSNLGKGSTSREAENAIRAIGTNALPTVLKMLTSSDPWWSKYVAAWSTKHPKLAIKLTDARTRHWQAQAGYNVLGPVAQPHVRELSDLLAHSRDPNIRQCSAAALGSIGAAAAPAIPILIKGTGETTKDIRNNCYWALSRIPGEPTQVLPTLMLGLGDSFQVARENAALGIARYGRYATGAVPALTAAKATNMSASYALDQIEMDFAAQATNN